MIFEDIITASDKEFEWLHNNVVGCADEGQAYIFDDCELSNDCSPSKATIGFAYTDNQYALVCYEKINYRGHNIPKSKFFNEGAILCDDWPSLIEMCRAMVEPQSVANDLCADTAADWDVLRTEPDKLETLNPISFEALKNEMNKSVIGQPEAIDTVCYQVSRFLRKKNPKKPLSLLAYGPPGIGKSETAKSLAEILSRNSNHNYSAVWTDLNTFTEAHTVYRLIGSPPGYVGYEDKPVFEAVTNNPYTVFIFDELDKAHPEVLKTFMAILDEGRCASRAELRDGSREFNFKNCIFFFTSNYVLSGDNPIRKNPIGFSISNNVTGISFDDGAVNIGYVEEKHEEQEEDDTIQRIYKSTERARKEFIKCGTLAEIASRFHGFVEYKPLNGEAKAKILAKQIVETGFEYGIRIGYISKEIMQGIIDEVSTADSLTVRSFKAVIEGRLVDAFLDIDANNEDVYRIDGSISIPVLNKMQ